MLDKIFNNSIGFWIFGVYREMSHDRVILLQDRRPKGALGENNWLEIFIDKIHWVHVPFTIKWNQKLFMSNVLSRPMTDMISHDSAFNLILSLLVHRFNFIKDLWDVLIVVYHHFTMSLRRLAMVQSSVGHRS